MWPKQRNADLNQGVLNERFDVVVLGVLALQ